MLTAVQRWVTKHGERGDGRHPGRQGLRVVQGCWSPQVVEHACGRCRRAEDPSAASYYVAGVAAGQAGADGEVIRELAPDLGVVGVRRAGSPGGAEDAKSKMGLASLLKMMWGRVTTSTSGTPGSSTTGCTPTSRSDGTFSVVPQMKRRGHLAGPATATIADVADKYEVPMVKLTGGQRIDLLGIKQGGPAQGCGLTSGCRRATPTARACARSRPAWDRTSAASAPVTPPSLGDRAGGPGSRGWRAPAKMKLAVSGCPRNCAESLRQGRRRRRDRGWPVGDLHRRRGRSAHPQGAICSAPSTTAAEAVTPLVGRFLQYYRENAKWLERTYAFVPRIGLDVIKDGHRRGQSRASPRGWTRRCRSTPTRYVDPWTERVRSCRPPDSSPVVAAARGAAAGAGPMSRAPPAAQRCLVSTDTVTPLAGMGSDDQHDLGPVALVPFGEGRAFAVARRADCGVPTPRRAGSVLSRRSARTRAARSPTGRPTHEVVLCPVAPQRLRASTPVRPRTGAPPLLRRYPVVDP